MKKAKIIDVFSPDIEDLYSYTPIDSENFCLLLQICVGIAGDLKSENSGETFTIEVYTPQWLISNYKKDEVIVPKYSLIVFEYNFAHIYDKLVKNIESCYGNTWDEIAKKISAFALWEFEDYEEIT